MFTTVQLAVPLKGADDSADGNRGDICRNGLHRHVAARVLVKEQTAELVGGFHRLQFCKKIHPLSY